MSILHTMEIAAVSALSLCALGAALAIVGGFIIKCKNGWCQKH